MSNKKKKRKKEAKYAYKTIRIIAIANDRVHIFIYNFDTYVRKLIETKNSDIHTPIDY